MGKERQPISTDGFRIYIGNLSRDIPEKNLRSFLEAAIPGDELTDLYRSKYTDKKSKSVKYKNFAYVSVKKEESAQKLLKLNGKDLAGKTIRVDRASAGPHKASKSEEPKKEKPQKSKPTQEGKGKPGKK